MKVISRKLLIENKETGMQLGEIADLTAGVLTSRVLYDGRRVNHEELKDSAELTEKMKESSGVPIKVLVPKAIKNGRIDEKLLEDQVLIKDPKTGKEKNVDDFKTKDGDIVIKLSSPYDSCLITPEFEGLLIPSFCMKIVVKEKLVKEKLIDRDFFLAYLSSDFFKTELRNKCHGAVTALTKKSDFMRITVPEVPGEKQIEIGQRFRKVTQLENLMNRYRELERERLDRILEETGC